MYEESLLSGIPVNTPSYILRSLTLQSSPSLPSNLFRTLVSICGDFIYEDPLLININSQNKVVFRFYYNFEDSSLDFCNPAVGLPEIKVRQSSSNFKSSI